MRGSDEVGERFDLAVGEAQREPHRNPEQAERDEEQRQVKAQLQGARALGQAAVIVRHRLRAFERLEEDRFRIARGVEEYLVGQVDRRQRLDPVFGSVDDEAVAIAQRAHRFAAETARFAALGQVVGRDGADCSVLDTLQDRGLVNLAAAHLVVHELDEFLAGERRRAAVLEIEPQIARHRGRLVGDFELVLLVIFLRQLVGIAHQPLRIVRNPEIDARLK